MDKIIPLFSLWILFIKLNYLFIYYIYFIHIPYIMSNLYNSTPVYGVQSLTQQSRLNTVGVPTYASGSLQMKDSAVNNSKLGFAYNIHPLPTPEATFIQQFSLDTSTGSCLSFILSTMKDCIFEKFGNNDINFYFVANSFVICI